MTQGPPAGDVDLFVGRVLDARYRVTKRLGEGAMSAVYRAEQSGGPPVAIKVLHEEMGEDDRLRERFEREARALFALEHPNIIEVHDFGIVDGQPYLVMELLEGTTLDRWLEEGGLDPETALVVARQILAGLSFAHAQGILHRDLKTENVSVCRDARGNILAKLLDFGLVKFADEDRWGSGNQLTTLGSVFGSPAYMSPEQVSGAPVDVRADVYSCGVILFELLTGIWPFMEEERVDMFRAHVLNPPPTLAETMPELEWAPAVEALIQKALEKERDARFADAGAMLSALDALPRPVAHPKGAAPQASGAVPAAPGAVPRPGASGGSGPSPLVLIAAGVAIAGILLVAAAVAAFVLLG